MEPNLYQQIADALNITQTEAKRKVAMFGYGYFDALPAPGPAILDAYTTKLRQNIEKQSELSDE